MNWKNILVVANEARIGRAVKCLLKHSYQITYHQKDAVNIKATVSNGKGDKYAIWIRDDICVCSCPDCIKSGEVCKHALMCVFDSVLRGEK